MSEHVSNPDLQPADESPEQVNRSIDFALNEGNIDFAIRLAAKIDREIKPEEIRKGYLKAKEVRAPWRMVEAVVHLGDTELATDALAYILDHLEEYPSITDTLEDGKRCLAVLGRDFSEQEIQAMVMKVLKNPTDGLRSIEVLRQEILRLDVAAKQKM